MKGEKRIDNLRAVAILLVIIGHSIILYSSSWGVFVTKNECAILNYFKEWINLIQMPLFFSVSGYLFYGTVRRKSYANICIDKVKRLLIPFFIIGFLWMIPIRSLIHFGNKSVFVAILDFVLLKDTGHLWYLPCLTICFILTLLLLMVKPKRAPQSEFVNNVLTKLGGWGTLLAGCILYGLAIGTDLLKAQWLLDLCKNYIWFAAGYFIAGNDVVNKFRFRSVYAVAVSILCIAVSLIIVIYVPRFKIMGTLLLLMCGYGCMPECASSVLSKISQNSFGLYLLHSPLVYITYNYLPNANPALVVLINLLWAVVAYFMVEGLRKMRCGWMIGEKLQKRRNDNK